MLNKSIAFDGERNVSSATPSRRAILALPSLVGLRTTTLARVSIHSTAHLNRLLALLIQLLRLRALARGSVPIPDHLSRENGVEHEGCDEAVEDERVGHFLQRGEDAAEGAGEVVEDLQEMSASKDTIGNN